MLYWRAGVCPLAVAYFVTEDSVDKFSHLEELINSRTPHAVGHISRTVEPQAAKIACASTNRIVQACVIFYTQAAFLYSYCYEQQHNAYILVRHQFTEMHDVISDSHVWPRVITHSWPVVSIQGWRQWKLMATIKCSKPLLSVCISC